VAFFALPFYGRTGLRTALPGGMAPQKTPYILIFATRRAWNIERPRARASGRIVVQSRGAWSADDIWILE
jgi:hypothetical protein